MHRFVWNSCRPCTVSHLFIEMYQSRWSIITKGLFLVFVTFTEHLMLGHVNLLFMLVSSLHVFLPIKIQYDFRVVTVMKQIKWAFPLAFCTW